MNQSTASKTAVLSQPHSEIISTQVQGGGNVAMNVTFIMAEHNTKIALNTRRKYEAQVRLSSCCYRIYQSFIGVGVE